MKRLLKKWLGKNPGFSSGNYWEKRYSSGGNSGDGSYGRLAVFKATFLNAFIEENNIRTVVEFGCGDGHQLSLIHYPRYMGLDVSGSIIRHCAEKFRNDGSKSFMLYDTAAFFNNQFIEADLSLSLDVVYHIVEEPLYQKYLHDLFATSGKYVVVYSTNFDKAETTHVLHREFVKDVQRLIREFEFIKEVPNPYQGKGEQESEANFYIFKRR